MSRTKMVIEGKPVEIDFSTGEVAGEGEETLRYFIDSHIEHYGYRALQGNMTVMKLKNPYRDMPSLVYLLRSRSAEFSGPKDMMDVPPAPYTKAHVTPGVRV